MSNIENKNDSRGGIQVIARAAKILRALKTDPNGMSLGKIAKMVELPRSTVQRIVAALQVERMVISDANGRGIRLGPELNSLAEATRYDIVESCRPFLKELSEKTSETADLSVFLGTSMIFLDQVTGNHRLRTISSVGETFPMTTTANGRACLSRLSSDKAVTLIIEEWKKRGIEGNINDFMEDLNQVRADGLARDIDRHTEGISAVGFAFRDWIGDLHSISVPVPTSRFESKRESIEKHLQETAQKVRDMIKLGIT